MSFTQQATDVKSPVRKATNAFLQAKSVHGAARWFAQYSTPIASLSLLAFLALAIGYSVFNPGVTEIDSFVFALPVLIVALPAAVIVAMRNIYEMSRGN